MPLLPGFGRPLTYVPQPGDSNYIGGVFPSALYDVFTESRFDYGDGRAAQALITLRELAMLRFMNDVTDKIDWHVKANDDLIAQKWKDEVCNNTELNFSPKMADWCIAELRYMASLRSVSAESPPPIFVYNGDVMKSDNAVSLELKRALQDAVQKFEAAIPLKMKDWHPGSDGKVLDLVHPSLYPLVYGLTRILSDGETTTLEDCIERCGQGEIVPVPQDTSRHSYMLEGKELEGTRVSTKFQWLPCEVDISGDNVKITSYINNLHPIREKHLYEVIAKLVDASIPLWNATLAPLADQDFIRERRIPYTKVNYDPDPRYWPESEHPQRRTDEDEFDYMDRIDEWIKAKRCIVFPEPEGNFRPLSQPVSFDLRSKYRNHGLQVIVKLANIVLTPEKPEYEGGTWHVEGQMNENIVATSLYYYSSDNITTSALSFRQQSETESTERSHISYEQEDHGWLFNIFGCKDYETVQDVGKVVTHEGRLLTFPNVLYHRVEPFRLSDPTKSGHRKIVALFLVDPNIKIISTAYVPCQQQEWWWEAIMAKQNTSTKGGLKQSPAIANLPVELLDEISEEVDFPLNVKEAKNFRTELMAERKAFRVKRQEFADSWTFSLCEH